MKKIRKIMNSVGVVSKVLNIFSDSKENTYSCDYINKLYEHNILTATFSGNSTTNNGTAIPIVWNSETITKIGSNITIDQEDSSKFNIKNLSYIKVSVDAMIQSDVAETNLVSLYILKNGETVYSVLSSCINTNGSQDNLCIKPHLIEVEENDIITIYVSSNKLGAVRKASVTLEGIE